MGDHGLTILNSYQDRGVSAYRGKNRKAGELAVILSRIESGNTKPGEHLIIENVDRLSLQEPLEALDLLREILRKRIVVHFVLARAYYTQRSLNEDFAKLMGLMFSMARAYEESRLSRLNGQRIGPAKANKGESDDIFTKMVRIRMTRSPSACDGRDRPVRSRLQP